MKLVVEVLEKRLASSPELLKWLQVGVVGSPQSPLWRDG